MQGDEESTYSPAILADAQYKFIMGVINKFQNANGLKDSNKYALATGALATRTCSHCTLSNYVIH